MSRHPILEVCCADIGSVRAAIAGGTDRIELCSALEVGGLTPSQGLMEEAVGECHLHGVKVHILIRPRPGDFVYNSDEIRVMMADVSRAIEALADGIVVGALTRKGHPDIHTLEWLTDLWDGDFNVTFHRAFDLCCDPIADLGHLISSGRVNRILTSGLAPSAGEGIPMLRELVKYAGEMLSIMPGAGVTGANAAEILRATRAREIHASAKTSISSAMTFRRDNVSMGAADADEYSRFVTSAPEVAAIKKALSTIDLQP